MCKTGFDSLFCEELFPAFFERIVIREDVFRLAEIYCGLYSCKNFFYAWAVIELLGCDNAPAVIIDADEKVPFPSLYCERGFQIQLPKLIRLGSAEKLPRFLLK